MTITITDDDSYEVGSLVRCREREWVVMPSDDKDILLLRPLGGSENELIGIHLPLNRKLKLDQIVPATFPSPDLTKAGDHTAGKLLRDATRLNFRSGAGPFRSLGRIDVKPRPFQLVPLLMALRLDPVRLLIADDVGIGKTIEAGLIARELLDRGEVKRLAVVCPPHLCEQWQRELREKFALDAVVVRSGTIAQLERSLPPGDITVYEHFPIIVVSIDFVKSERRRDSFVRGCPDLVIVDEAHTAARSSGSSSGGGNQQQRHELLRAIAAKPERSLLLLTATPHSGVEDAFMSLLELLDPNFARLNMSHLSEQERTNLARHFVQRRRADVQRWLGADDETPFPIRESREITYELKKSPEYRKLFDDIYSFARDLVRDNSAISNSGGNLRWKQRVRYWAALALLRCVMSSPAAAEAALRERVKRLSETSADERDELVLDESEDLFAQYVLDLSEQQQQENVQDFEPTTVMEESEQAMGSSERQKLLSFVKRAISLRGERDPKLQIAVGEVAALVKDGFQPIVFCRYVATAEYLAEELKRRLSSQWKDIQVVAVTGLSSEEEREQRVAELSTNPRRVLVATDCLSEGINLQEAFNAILHYDLPWNPNRLEQREGRVDRYGQAKTVTRNGKAEVIVRTILLYGQDNLIDEAVLRVLLRKAVSIHKTLGITVPLPVDSQSVVETVIQALFEKNAKPEQLSLFDTTDFAVGTNENEAELDVDELHASWDRAAEREKQSRTLFAQRAIKPEEVAQELYETEEVLGSTNTVASFVRTACERLGCSLTLAREGSKPSRNVWKLAPLTALPPFVCDRITTSFAIAKRGAAPTLPNEVLITFEGPVPEGVHLIGRLHPLTEALAEHLLDTALDSLSASPNAPASLLPVASRCGVTRTSGVRIRTTLLLVRMRLLIDSPIRPSPLLAEELVVVGFEGRPDESGKIAVWLEENAALALLEKAEPSGNLTLEERSSQLEQAINWLELESVKEDLNRIAQTRAESLRKSHLRVRDVTRIAGKVSVRPQLPLDILGVYVLLPVPKGLSAVR